MTALGELRDAAKAVVDAHDAGRLVAVPDELPSPEMDRLRDVLYGRFTDYGCGGVERHLFAVPWGDETPRSTVVCPVCGATAFIVDTG